MLERPRCWPAVTSVVRVNSPSLRYEWWPTGRCGKEGGERCQRVNDGP